MDTLTTVLRYLAACDTAAFLQKYLIINKFHAVHVNTFRVAHFAHCTCPYGFFCITSKKNHAPVHTHFHQAVDT